MDNSLMTFDLYLCTVWSLFKISCSVFPHIVPVWPIFLIDPWSMIAPFLLTSYMMWKMQNALERVVKDDETPLELS